MKDLTIITSALCLSIVLVLSDAVFALRITQEGAGIEELETYLRREDASGGEATRWRPLTATPGLKGPKTYDGISREFLPHKEIPILADGLTPLLILIEKKAAGKRWKWVDGGAGFGWALQEATANDQFPNLDAVAVDAVHWTDQDVPSALKDKLLPEALSRGIRGPWDVASNGKVSFIQRDLAAADLTESGRYQPDVITTFAVLNYSSNPLGALVHLYNQLRVDGYLLSHVYIPRDYPRLQELVDFYDSIFSRLKETGIRVDWKWSEIREESSERLIATILGVVLEKSPGRLSLQLSPQKPYFFRTQLSRAVEFPMVHYTGDLSKPFKIELSGLEDHYAVTQILSDNLGAPRAMDVTEKKQLLQLSGWESGA